MAEIIVRKKVFAIESCKDCKFLSDVGHIMALQDMAIYVCEKQKDAIKRITIDNNKIDPYCTLEDIDETKIVVEAPPVE